MMYDVVIVGAGVTGTATLYTLSRFTNVKKIALVEKYGSAAQVNSHKDNNAQTLHVGDIETNYNLEKAKKVRDAAYLIARYADSHKSEKFHSKTHKMVLGVGKEQADFLKKRHKEFKKLFPQLRIIGRDIIAKKEPLVVKGRHESIELCALYSDDGYIVDYGKLSESFIKNSNQNVDVRFNTEVKNIIKTKKGYIVNTNKGTLEGKTVVVCAGSHSLNFAYELGYGKDWILLPVAGTFFKSKKTVNGKVYRLQLGSVPFSAVHADPDVHDHNETRYGPRAKVLPMLERWNYRSVPEFFKLFELRFDAVLASFKVLFAPMYFKYLLKQILYDLPLIGKRFFMREINDIIPTLKVAELKKAKIGGIRPQILDVKKQRLVMGEAKLTGDKILFEITPSPGASVSLKTGYDNAQKVVSWLGCTFDSAKWKKELS